MQIATQVPYSIYPIPTHPDLLSLAFYSILSAIFLLFFLCARVRVLLSSFFLSLLYSVLAFSPSRSLPACLAAWLPNVLALVVTARSVVPSCSVCSVCSISVYLSSSLLLSFVLCLLPLLTFLILAHPLACSSCGLRLPHTKYSS